MCSRMRLFLLLVLAILFYGCQDDSFTPTIKYWYENIGSNKNLPLLPDSNVNYFLYSFKRNKGDQIGIRIKGQYGYARYMSFNIYDNNTISSVGSIVDVRIIPDAGSTNPYLPASDPDVTNRDYTVNIFPRESADSLAYPNSLLYDDKLENIGIILRYYVPKNDPYASVSLPKVEAFDVGTGQSVATPPPVVTDFDAQFKEKYKKISLLLGFAALLEAPKDVYFYRFSGIFLYPNFDNYYLFSPITFNKNQVVMLRLKAPTFPHSNADNDISDVRYFSFCLCDDKTYTYKTTTDIECKIADADGYINLVIGEDDAALRTKAAGLNYIVLPTELQNNVKGLIIYRNLLTRTGFPYSMGKVPDVSQHITLENILNISNLQAQTYMSGYAPVGKKMTKAQFLDNFGGFPVSY